MTQACRPPVSMIRTPLDTYFRDIRQTPLLSAHEERELARRIENGDLEARNHMVRANLRLVVRIARYYLDRGLSLEDLIEEGNLGLLRAAEAFDRTRNTRFSTYAAHWIKESIRRNLMHKVKTIRIPEHMVTVLGRWRQAAVNLQDELGRQPTEDEVALRLNLSRRKLPLVKRALRTAYVTSLGARAGNEWSPDETLLDSRAQAPDSDLSKREELGKLKKALDRLDERSAAVLRLRFGLDGQEPKTLEVVGQRLGVTRERIRQIEKEALTTLRQILRTE